MPHFPKPFFRKDRRLWYVQIGAKQHNLGPDWETAEKRYHELMHQPDPPPVRQDVPAQSVLDLLDKFLEWCRQNRAKDTYEWYLWRLQLFAKFIDKQLTVSHLRPYHLDEWLAKHPDWSSGTRHGMCRAVQRALRWAEKKGYIDRSPIAHYEKPRPGKRKVVIAPAEFERLLSLAGSENFRDLLLVTWETACRPQESLAVEARHVDLDNARWVFPADEAKGEQWPRVVYLTDTALAITKRLMLEHPEGPLFRNTDGRPWTTDAVNCAFIRLQTRLGLQAMKNLGIEIDPVPRMPRSQVQELSPAERHRYRKEREDKLRQRQKLIGKLARQHGKKYCLYNLRHSWLDRALKRGVDALTCAILMGHRDPSTISKVYQHLSQSPDYLREAAKKAAG